MAAVTQQVLEEHVDRVRAQTSKEFENQLTSLKVELKNDYDLQVKTLRDDMERHWGRVGPLIESEITKLKDERWKEKGQSLTARYAFKSLPKYGGKPEEHDDWRFQVGAYMSEDEGYHELFVAMEKLLKPPSREDMAEIYRSLVDKYPKIDMAKMNKELYLFLSMNLQGKALALVKNLFAVEDINGFLSWWKLGYENNAMTAQRMQAITNRVLAPKRCKRYAEVSAALEDWEYALSVYERVEGHELSEQAKIFSIKRVVPEELQDDVNRLNNLDSFAKVKGYILEQVLVRRDTGRNTSNGPVGMDVDLMQKMIATLQDQGQEESSWKDEEKTENKEEESECRECGDGTPEGVLNQLLSMVKGKGKTGGKAEKFEGYCSKCHKWGHMARNCWTGQGKGKGKGNDKGKGQNSWDKSYGKSGKGGGKSAYGLMWDLAGGSGSSSTTPAPKPAWTMSLTKAPPAPPGLKIPYEVKNAFEILTCRDLENEKALETDMDRDFPEPNAVNRNSKKVYMPRMVNYSKNSVKKNTLRENMVGESKDDKNKETTIKNNWNKNNGTKSCQTINKTTISKHLNIFIKEPIKKTLDPFVSQQAEDGWLQVKGVMDSGASESVAPANLAPQYTVTSSPGSLVGQEYTSASGNVIPNLGEKVLDIVMEDGRETQVKYQVADVSRPLNSISEICDAGGKYGQIVLFGRTGGAILNLETGIQTPFAREDGIYTMDVWVKPKGFPRQGA